MNKGLEPIQWVFLTDLSHGIFYKDNKLFIQNSASLGYCIPIGIDEYFFPGPPAYLLLLYIK